MALESKLKRHTARVAVIGLGYVGLPQAMAMADAGFHVTGIDLDGERVASLRAGHSYVADVSPSRVRGAVRAGRFEARADFAPT